MRSLKRTWMWMQLQLQHVVRAHAHTHKMIPVQVASGKRHFRGSSDTQVMNARAFLKVGKEATRRQENLHETPPDRDRLHGRVGRSPKVSPVQHHPSCSIDFLDKKRNKCFMTAHLSPRYL